MSMYIPKNVPRGVCEGAQTGDLLPLKGGAEDLFINPCTVRKPLYIIGTVTGPAGFFSDPEVTSAVTEIVSLSGLSTLYTYILGICRFSPVCRSMPAGPRSDSACRLSFSRHRPLDFDRRVCWL